MDLFDLLIIYFACGAPFAVYHVVSSHDRESGWRSFSRPFLVLLLWPFFAGDILLKTEAVRRLYDSDRAEMVVREFELTEFRRHCEHELIRRDPGFRVLAFREAFERYVGLALEIRNADREPVESIRELLRISGRPAMRSAEQALRRAGLRKLVAHRDNARLDLSEYLTFDPAAIAKIEMMIEGRERSANPRAAATEGGKPNKIALDRAA